MGRNSKANMFVDIISLHKEVTGSCNICTIRFPNKRKVKFIVDCGLFQEEKYYLQNYYFPFDPSDLSFALITHNHIDHIGRLPKLYKDGFKGKTYTSKITSKLMPYALNNTAEILCSNNQRNPNKNKELIENSSIPVFSNNSLSEPLFTADDVNSAMENVEGIEYNTEFNIDDHIKVTFFSNGHLLGAASILVTIKYKGEKPINLFFSGDYSDSNAFFDVDDLPKKIQEKPITVIQESTYGTSSKKDIKYVFKNNILKSIKNKETLIIPVFALGRTQEILLELKKLQDENLLKNTIPIYLDGKLAQTYTKFYKTHPEYLKKDTVNFLPKSLNMVIEHEQRQQLLSDRNCKIILTTSGMGSYGPAQLYLPYYIAQPKCTIHFCGYTTPNTFRKYN